MSYKVAFFSAKEYDQESFNKHNTEGLAKFHYTTESISKESFTKLGDKFDAVCVFVNDVVDANVLDFLKKQGVKLILNRCAGFDRVDVKHAEKLGILCTRVPAYSPYAVAEQAVSLLCALNRKLHIAYSRTQLANFSIDNLVGIDLFGKTVGIIGTGRIGQILADIMTGFGCKIAAFDVFVNEAFAKRENVTYYKSPEEVYAIADVISLHSPLLDSTRHMINKTTIAKMKKGVIIVNCARGGLVNTKDLLQGIANGTIRGYGTDVYENEAGIFFNDCQMKVDLVNDRDLCALMACPNVLISAHQAFLTEEALDAIAKTTLTNIKDVLKDGVKEGNNFVTPSMC